MMTIRELKKQDFEQWAHLRLLLWPDCDDTDKQFRSYFSKAGNQKQRILVAEDNQGNLTAFLEGAIHTDYVQGASTSPVGYVGGIFVASTYRNQGIGQALIDHFSSWLKSKGISELGSDCELNNRGSYDFHIAIGFAEESRNIHFIKKL